MLSCLLLSSSVSLAKLVPARDYRNGILGAELVVFVSQESPGRFRVEEAFLGSANCGDSIELPGFRLFTYIVEPITPDKNAGAYGGDKLHQKLTNYIKAALPEEAPRRSSA